MSAWRRVWSLALAVGMVAASIGAADAARVRRHVDATEQDFWVMTTAGYSVHPCQPVVVEPNVTRVPDEHRAAARAQMAEVIGIYNAIIGRDVFRLGGDTTRGSRTNDGHHVYELSVHGDPDGDASTVRYASGKGRVVGTGTVDGFRHVTDFGGEMDLELNPTSYSTSIDTFVHEFGHGLGFHHNIDGRSIMSYSRTRRHYYDSLDDQRRWGPAFVKAIQSLFPADCAYVTLGQRHDWRKGGPDKNESTWFFDEEIPALNPNIDTVREVGRDMVDGPNGVAWQVKEPVSIERLVVCRDDVFADCLAGSALAGTIGAVAFVEGGPDGYVTDKEMTGLLATSTQDTEVIILGGSAAVSDVIEDRFRQAVEDQRIGTVTRIKGEVGTGRYGTATAVADRMLAEGASSEFVLVARSDNPVDAVAAGAFAARNRLPIVLTEPGQLTESTQQWLASHSPGRVAVLGGRAAVGDGTFASIDAVAGQVERVSGSNRRATSVAIARHPWLWQRHVVTSSSRFYLVNGKHEDAWALALAAAPWAAREQAPILLTEYDHLGFTADGADGGHPDPGWYLWSLQSSTRDPGPDDPTGFIVMGNFDGDFTHPSVGSSAYLTANAKSIYQFDG